MIAERRKIEKKAQEAARYALPVATFAYLYHTVSGLTLLRYYRTCGQFDTPLEQQIILKQMVDRLLELESQGTVVYVMRYSSRLDYVLFNTLFARVGLRLSSFANGLHFYYYRPLLEALRMARCRQRGRPKEIEHGDVVRVGVARAPSGS